MSTYNTPGASRTMRRRAGRHRQTTWMQLLRGLLSAIGVTLAGILVFALLMQWLRPSDTVIRVINQLIKLAAIFVGAYVTVGRGGDKGMLLGAAIGFAYMLLGVALYALLSGQQLPFTSYLSDVAMGIAGGGIAGAIISGMHRKQS